MSVTVLPRVPQPDHAARGRTRRRHREEARPARGLGGRLVGLVAVAVILVGGWWVTNSPLFDLRTLTVTGLHHLSQDEVARLAGLRDHTNVLWLSTSAVARRLEADPWVLRVEVSRTLPSSLTIVIEERRAVAVLMPSNRLVAQDGVLLGTAGAVRLPRVEGTIARVSGRSWAAPSASLAVVRSLPASLARLVAQVAIDPAAGVTLYLRDGARAIFGDASAAAAKASALQAVLRWADRSGTAIDYVDVRAPAAPALLPRGAASPA